MATSGYILIKLAARCNINCTYCYWFKDKTVYDKPPIMKDEVVEVFVEKLETHIKNNKVPIFNCIFHGGEPLLYPKDKFIKFLNLLEALKKRTSCQILYSITSNGLLLDLEWINIFKKYDVSVSISIDGTKEFHDRNRIKFNGTGTHDEVVAKIRLLQNNNLSPSLISVCNTESDPIKTIDFFVKELGISRFNLLLPDHTYDDKIKPISDYYVKMFDYWYETYLDKGIEVKFFSNIIRVLLGLPTKSDSFGYGPVHVITLLTDGALEPLDVTKIQGDNATDTQFNILKHEIEDVKNDPKWKNIFDSSLELNSKCKNCIYKLPCGGGHITTRWSIKNGYDNPSVYCEDFMVLFEHVINKISNDISIMA